MKKMMTMILAFSMSLMTAFASEVTVSERVLTAFHKEFNTAKEVSWTTGNSYYKASFTFNEQRVYAYFGFDGSLIGVARYITSLDMPIALQSSLKKDYENYWISDLFEVTKEEGTSYFITLEDADTTIVLQADADGTTNVYKKIKKA